MDTNFVSNHECGIGISPIFDSVFKYHVANFLTVLQYWVPPRPPPKQLV